MPPLPDPNKTAVLDLSSPAEPGAERRQLSVLFRDLAGSTALSARLDPEDLRDVMARYYQVASEALKQHGGYIARFFGDGLLVYFGWPTAHEDNAERAVRGGIAAAEAVSQLKIPTGPLAVRVGIATGPVVVGDIVNSETRERNVIGETPNLAARLLSGADPGEIVADEATRRLTGAMFEWIDLGMAELKGLPRPVRIWRALSQAAMESRSEALHSRPLSPLIGRDEELELLVRRWRRAASGEGQIVLISGEAGIGKSRLVAALQEAMAASGEECERLEWFCSPHHQDSALHPIITRLERAAGIVREDTPEERLAKLETLLRAVDPTPDELGLIADLLGVPTGGQHPRPDLSPQSRRERTLDALIRRVEALANRRPVLGVLEDAHWADPTTLELLDLLAGCVDGLALLFVVTHRPEFRAPWAGQAYVTELRLSRLGRRDKAALVEQVAGGPGTLQPEIVAEIVERTDGVPLFIEELTRAALEAGGVMGLQPAFAAGAIVPATLHASLTARLDRLGATTRRVAQAGAAIGREFGHDLLAAIAGLPEEALESALQRLEDAELIHCRSVPPEAIYSFRHVLLRDAAYGMLLREPRRALHVRIAEAILRLHPDAAEREPHLLARHYTGAGLAELAIEYWRRAAEQSVTRFANREAIAYFERALDLVEALPTGGNRDRLEADLRLNLVVPLVAIHGFGSVAVEDCAVRAKVLGEQSPDWPGRFAAHKVVWNSCLLRQPVPRGSALARELLALAEWSGDPARIAVACRAFGFSLCMAGKPAEADPVLARSITLADQLEDTEFAVYGEDPRIICRLYLGEARCRLGYPEEGLRIAGEGLARARTRNNPHAIAWSLLVLGGIHTMRRDAPRVEQAGAEAIDIARHHRFPQWLALAQQQRGWALLQLGDTTRGMVLIEEGLRHQHATGQMLYSTVAYCDLAEGCVLASRPKAALGHLEAAHRHAQTYGEHFMSAEIHRLHAEVLQIQGAPPPEIGRHL
jgi:class 3 adenylate cyclase